MDANLGQHSELFNDGQKELTSWLIDDGHLSITSTDGMDGEMFVSVKLVRIIVGVLIILSCRNAKVPRMGMFGINKFIGIGIFRVSGGLN
jgi:hypothetical protein